MYQMAMEILKNEFTDPIAPKGRAFKQEIVPCAGQGSKRQSWAMICPLCKLRIVCMHCVSHRSFQRRHPLQTHPGRSSTMQCKLPSRQWSSHRWDVFSSLVAVRTAWLGHGFQITTLIYFFCGRRPLPFGGSHLRLPSGPAGIRTTTGSLSALARPTPYQLSHRVA